MDTQQTKLRVVMLPWLAHGHVSPFIELAKELSHRNFHIYFCSTPIILNSVKDKITDSNDSIELIELHLPPNPDLPPNLHTTKGLPPHLSSILMKSFLSCAPTFSTLLHDLHPDLVLYDMCGQWVPSLAATLNIPAVFLCVTGATSASFFLHLSELIGKKVVPLGPLLHPNPTFNEDDVEQVKILQWLDKKEPFSTVFVSFGSEFYLGKEDLEELAHGLELSNVNFIWVVRFPTGEKLSIEEAMPNGFLERVGERGFVVDGWAPQAKILSHGNVGGYVSHCGWGSTLEGMYFGVPIVAMPMQLEHPIIGRLVEEVGVGVEVLRGGDGKFKREEVARVIKEVVVEESGVQLRKKVKQVGHKLKKEGEEAPNVVAQEITRLICEMKF